ncbi:O-antigen ligase [Massilia sp. Root335]|uniref:O-antigen ligase family protein n=1 Tax=Massilia sp. Root335 TaxID=1736517 RepID=UPI0006F4CA7E|nr:O-antigen ligase family protein [Massilia sp. Root335]
MSGLHLQALQRTRFLTLLCLALLANFMVVAGHNHQRLVEIGTVLLGASIVLLDNRMTPADVFLGTSGKALAAFFVLGIVGIALAFAPRFAAFEVANLFLLYLLASAVAAETARNGQPSILLVTRCLAAACAPYVLLFIVAYVAGLSLGIPLALDDFTTNFSNIRFFNHTQTSTLPLLILLCCLTPRSSKLRWLWLAVTTYWWMALFATNGRGTLLGAAAGCIATAVLAQRRAVPYLRQVAVTMALGLLAYLIFLVVVPALLGVEGMHSFSYAVERTAADPTSARWPLWHLAFALIGQHPWLGVGPMHFAHYTGQLHIAAHPHDWLLQIGAEWGLPALLCLLTAVAFGLRALLRAGAHIGRDDADNQAIFAALILGAVAILVDGLVSGLFVMPQSQLAIALYLGCAIGWQRTVGPAMPAAAPGAVRRAAGTACVIVAMAGVVAGAWPEALAKLRNEALTPAQKALNTGTEWPRLWKPGYF